MKSKKILVFVSSLLLCFLAFCLFVLPSDMPKKPFINLSMLNVNSVEIVNANAGHKIDGIYLLDVDSQKLLSIISDIKIKGRVDDEKFDYEVLNYSYWPEMFCIRMRDGKTLRIGINRFTSYYEPIEPILYIDFVEYNVNKESTAKCEELINFYEALAQKYGLDTRLLYF